MSITPYYDSGGITIYHGRCEDTAPCKYAQEMMRR